MMRLLLTIVLGLMSTFSWALGDLPSNRDSESCSVNANSDFTVYFNISGALYIQNVELQQPGSHEDFYLLSTSRSETAEMYDVDLYVNGGTLFREYDAAITYEAATNELNYYRKATSTTSWGAPLDSSVREIHNGNSTVIESTSGTSNIRCEDSLPSFERQYSDDAMYEFGVASCNGGSCDISFEETFDITPLVFIMPTIDTGLMDADIPASLSVTSVSTTSASIVQEIPSAISSSNSEPMTSVSYLAIEPGVAYFDGNKVYADYADISSTSTNATSNFTSVDFSQNPNFVEFTSTPVVLGQVQSRNNDDNWITTGIKSVSRVSVDLSLELSRSSVSGYNYNSEQIAFLVTEPFTGTVEDTHVEFSRSFSTLNTLNGSNDTPIADSCAVYASTSLNSLTGVVASQQTRNGSDGGWLRRCDINGSEVSFVIEEDTTNSGSRAHISEEIGYFVFYEEIEDIGVCQLFPAPAQSWYTKGTTPNNDDNLSLTNPKTSDFHINGWPSSYVYQGSDNKYYVNTAFDNVSDHTYSSNYNCESGYCINGLDSIDKVEVDLQISDVFPGDVLVIEGHNGNNGNSYKRVCGNNSQYCSYDKQGQDVTIYILKSLKSLSITSINNESFTVVFPAEDDFRIQNYNVYNSPVITEFSSGGNYTFENFLIHTQGNSIKTGTDTNIFVGTTFTFYNPIDVIQTGVPDDVTILGPDATMSIKINSGSQLKAKILANRLTLENSVLEGAATAKNLTLSQSGAKIIGNSSCFDTSQPTEYELVLEPTIDYSLVCDTQVLSFEVRDQSGVANDFSGTVFVEASNGGLLSSDSTTTGVSSGTFSVVNGVLTLYLTKTNAGEVDVEASLVNYSDADSANGIYQFVPFSFDSDTQKVVAGREQQITIKVLACDDGSKTEVDNYDQSSVPYTHSLISPLTGTLGSLDISNESGGGTPVDFEDGIANLDITYWESGKSLLTLTDTNFDCSGFDDCPIDGTGTLSGAFEIHARPWTFAICDENGSAMDGTSSSGSAYTAAGELFSLKVIPIVYVESAGTADLESKCSADITTNFFASDAETATVYLRAEKQTPTSGVTGTGSSIIIKDESGIIISAGESLLHTANSGTTDSPYYLFNNLYWNEVGSLLISADIDDITDSDTNLYLDMTIDTGSREVGRFYPHHLTIIENSDTVWKYADNHSDFAYMGQDIEHNFIVQAESSRSDNEGSPLITTNYGRFGSSYISTITYRATANIPDSDGNDNWQNVESSRILPLNLAWSASDWGSSTGQITVGISDFSFVKNGATLDGPFNSSNSNFGLVSSKVDEVDFESLDFDSNLDGTLSGQRFSEQPDFRYGRMVLDDVGGNEGTNISIPLRVEYWDESSDDFIQNSQDSGSVLNSTGYCTQVLWSELSNSSNVTLEGASSNANVQTGEFSDLYAQQSTSAREQVKVWLRQGDNSVSGSNINCYGSDVDQPWLQYYWDGTEEEDPSAVVTFGIYRGNDRVIFRGENRFTGQ
ncbi:DUF6701 domain-containing protein [Vibrio algarum]|uniref:DUF6701 domain-containing protein n=2 Tax=Vibrio algarum TaxID=3020714 RepID=A0ABT4YMV0_9VIBR|nr:DUF6701 domain-containing protein [Vibrio sp. KJ40-1]MDB1122877.1 hypothetical protein [Vibrio sp. KJ40-1]